MEIKGKITKILEAQTGEKKDGSGSWIKQNFLVETDEKYNNLYCFEVFGDEKVQNFQKYNKVGQEVNVEFNVSTNEYKGNYYTSLSAWKISSEKKEEAPKEEKYKGKKEYTEPLAKESEPFDLPF
jgi:ribosomal protein S1